MPGWTVSPAIGRALVVLALLPASALAATTTGTGSETGTGTGTETGTGTGTETSSETGAVHSTDTDSGAVGPATGDLTGDTAQPLYGTSDWECSVGAEDPAGAVLTLLLLLARRRRPCP